MVKPTKKQTEGQEELLTSTNGHVIGDPFEETVAGELVKTNSDPFASADAEEDTSLRILLEGNAGSGKSHFIMGAAESLAVVDAEHTLQHFTRRRAPFKRKVTPDLPAMIAAMEWLAYEGKDTYDVVAIDSVTVPYAILAGKTVKELEEDEEDISFDAETKQRLPFNASYRDRIKMAELLTKICHVGRAHVLLTAHTADLTAGDDGLSVVPMTTYGLEYYVNLILKLELQPDGKTRIGTIKKDNTGTFELGERLTNPTFATIYERIHGSVPRRFNVPIRDMRAEAGASAAGAPELEELLAMAAPLGITRGQFVATCKASFGKTELSTLTPDERQQLCDRLIKRGARRLSSAASF